MKTLVSLPSRCEIDLPPRYTRNILLAAAAALLLAAAISLTSCASTSAGLHREQVIYSAGTNAVSQLQTLVPYVPAPLNTPVEAALALATAALAFWNSHQQRAISALKNGGSSPSSATGPASPISQG